MALPVCFTLPPSARHELLLLPLSPKPTLKSLNKAITALIATSPNCAEFMAKYKSSEAAADLIQEIRVRWGSGGEAGKGKGGWPE